MIFMGEDFAKKRKEEEGKMDSGPSWADQWDNNNPDPQSSSSKDVDKKKDANKSGMKKLQEKLMKVFGKKPQS
ncbi:Transcriptional repressor NF-X1-like protein [Bienertia sinuspersici]